jgi:hypothetical protein
LAHKDNRKGCPDDGRIVGIDLYVDPMGSSICLLIGVKVLFWRPSSIAAPTANRRPEHFHIPW